MTSREQPSDARAIAELIDTLSPEAQDAFFRVYQMLLEFGFSYLAEHPERVQAIVTRAAESGSDGEEREAGTCVE